MVQLMHDGSANTPAEEQTYTFCTRCGHKMATVPTGGYSAMTGEPMYTTKCENTKCIHGCRYRYGHDFGWLRTTCKHCGTTRNWEGSS